MRSNSELRDLDTVTHAEKHNKLITIFYDEN